MSTAKAGPGSRGRAAIGTTLANVSGRLGGEIRSPDPWEVVIGCLPRLGGS